MLRIRWLVITLMAVLSSAAFCERINLGEGLSIEPAETLGLVFETIPSYDASKKILTHKSEEKLQYFISVNSLPSDVNNNSAQYFTLMLRDLNAASSGDSVELIEQGQYKSDTGVSGSYIEYSFMPTGSTRTQHQVAHFLTRSGRSYVAIAALIDKSAAQAMLVDSLAAFRTASISWK